MVLRLSEGLLMGGQMKEESRGCLMAPNFLASLRVNIAPSASDKSHSVCNLLHYCFPTYVHSYAGNFMPICKDNIIIHCTKCYIKYIIYACMYCKQLLCTYYQCTVSDLKLICHRMLCSFNIFRVSNNLAFQA